MSSTSPPSDRSAHAVGAFFAGAGVMHFVRPDFFEAIVPRWFPSPKLANQVSGAAEIILGVGMMPRRTRPFAARGLLVLTAAVYPANIDMAINDVVVKPDNDGHMERVEGVKAARPQNLIRLPLQFVMAWAIRRHLRAR
ncbi:MAG: DoxX family protein [Acidimicrobiales bacterium]